MRRQLSFVFAIVVMVLTSAQTRAAIRVTDVAGREVAIERGPASPPEASKVSTDAGRVAVHADVTVNAGADTDLANNDYRRIQDAINAATPGDTITLSGTFDFSAPFAAASWALGNDNTAATGDDYGVTIPLNLANITLTAASLGDATIQGPGDLAALDLEAFLYFDGAGDNQDWTISNLQIFDFDMGIGMFNGAGGSDAYNNTVITNNLIRLPNDLNGTIAPGDPLQNIAIHYSFGTNQSILGNTIQIPGDSLSDVASAAASVGMQSNTSGGSSYDGLSIANNVIHVLNAQAAVPEVVLGFWENAHGHTSDISITGNQFLNDAAGNDPALNRQSAFRLSSHSGAATLVEYSSNQVEGANIGFQWMTGSNFAGNQAVVLTGNRVIGANTGVLVQSNGIAHIAGSDITGSGAGGGIRVITGSLAGSGANANGVSNSFVSGGAGDGILIEAAAGAIAPLHGNDLGNNAGFGLRNNSAPSILAERNWWGNNLAANVAAEVSGNADFDPWLASGTDVGGAVGFQPFLYATTSGTLTTFAGTAGADTGALLAGDPVTMQMAGESAFTALSQLLEFDIRLDTGDDLFTLGQTGIPTVFDGGADNDTLMGTNVAQTWNVTGAGSGNIPGATSSFAGVESLRGGTAADTFVFGAAGNLALTLDGDLGIDSLDNSAIPASTMTPTGPGTLDGFMGTATGIGSGFDNINALVGSAANLSISKSGPATATTSEPIAYTITLTNAGPDPAIGVELTDTLPAGTTFVSLGIEAGWSCTTPASGSGGTVTCTRFSMPVGTDEFTLTVNAPASPASISNTATVTSANEGAPGDESDTANTTVNGLADVSVTKTGPATATPNALIAYTITVTNGGPDSAVTLELTDTLPAGTTFVSFVGSGPWNCTTPAIGSGGTVTCTNASMAVGSDQFTLTVNAPPTPGPISNTATVTLENENAPGDESDTANTTVNDLADLSVTKSGPATADTNTPIAYTITVTNGGPGPALEVELADILPAGTTFVSLAAPAGWSCATPASGSGGTVTCTNASMAAGSDQFTLTINTPATPGPISNTATVTSTNEAAPGDESDTANTNLAGAADISVTKTGPATATTNTPIAYSITVTNGGPDPALDVELTDILPAGTTFVSLAAPAGWSCATPASGSGGTVTCTIASMAVGSDPFTLTVNAPTTPGPIANTATATSTNESAPGDESDTANTTVNGQADLSVTKSGPATADTDTPIAYTITVTNGGPDPALDVELTDILPAGTTFVSLAASAGWSCATPASGSGGTVTCTIASMAVGSDPFTLTVNAPATPGPIANTATATSTNESAPGNESDTANTTVNGLADLSVTKSGPATADTDTPIAYTITVTNGGPDPALDVELTDILPAGTTFVSLAAPAGWSCATPASGSGGTVSCTNASMAVGSDPFTLTVNTPATPGPISNTATVTSTNEAAPGDESDTANTNLEGAADLSVTKTGPATAGTDTPIAYTITVTNGGPDPALDVELTDILPAGTTFVSLAEPAGWSCATPAAGSGGTVTCTIASMAAGSDPFTLTVNTPATPGLITNTATVTSANEAAPGDESDTANTNLEGAADLSVTKTGPATAGTDTSIAYTITVTNGGPDPALDVELTDILPAGTTFVSLAEPGGWSCATPTAGSGGTVTCTIPSMAAGSDPFTLTVNTPATPGLITNTATVTSTNEAAPGDESDTATTTLVGIADLSIDKAAPPTVTSGDELTYTLTVANAGPDAATSVVVTDVLPVGVTFVSATPTQGSCSGTTTITCNLDTLNNGASATITLIVDVTAPPDATIVNTATVDSDETDPTAGDASDTASVPVEAADAEGIPMASEWTLLLLAMMLGALAMMRLKT